MVCQICGKKCALGVNAIVSGCDDCLEIERDRNHYCWFPGETEHKYVDLASGNVFVVRREDAFRKLT